MRVLLDTHALLWWLLGNRGLPANVLAVLAQTGNSITVSAASGWEISTKFRLGKLAVPRLLAETFKLLHPKWLDRAAGDNGPRPAGRPSQGQSQRPF